MCKARENSSKTFKNLSVENTGFSIEPQMGFNYLGQFDADIKQKFFTAGVVSTFRFPVGNVASRGSSLTRIDGPLQAWDLPATTEVCLEVTPTSNNVIVTGSLQVLLVKQNFEGDFF